MKKGVVNDKWKMITLGEVCIESNYGYTAKSSSDNRGVVYLRISDINDDGTINKNNVKYIEISNELYNKYKLEKGDIVIARSGSVGRSYLYNDEDGKMVFASYLIRFRINPNIVLPKFIELVLHSSIFYDYINMKKRKVAQTNINATELKGFEFPLPPFEDQEKIISILERAKNVKKIRIIANNETDMALVSYYFYLFGDINNNNLNQYPKDKLRNVTTISMGGTPSTKNDSFYTNGIINWMKSGDIKGDYINSVPYKITVDALKQSNAKIYKKGDVVIALNGQGKTRATTAILGLETSSNQSVSAISPDKTVLTSEFLHFTLKLRYQEIREITGDNQRSGLNLTILRNLDIQIPPINLQNKFTEFFKMIYKMKENQINSFQEIQYLNNSLIEEAICGRLALP